MQQVTATIADTGVFEDTARRAIANLLRVDQDRLWPDASLANDLRVDSLDFIALVMGLEREFDMNLPDAEVAQIRTVNEMIEFLRAQAALDGGAMRP